jgi:hypothetical protein
MYAFYTFSVFQELHIWAIGCISYHVVPFLKCRHIWQMLPALPTIVVPVTHYALQNSFEPEKCISILDTFLRSQSMNHMVVFTNTTYIFLPISDGLSEL